MSPPGKLAAALALLAAFPAAAHARAGDPDRGFGRAGTVTLKAVNADAVGGAVKVLRGGEVLAGGSAAGQFVVLRLRRTGSVDRRFGNDGQVVPQLPGTTLDGVRALATFRDGRIVATATLQVSGGTTRWAVVRLLPNGEVDPSFGGGLGYVLAGPDAAVLGAMVMDRTGDIVLAGARTVGAAEVPVVERLLPDGTPDPGFGAGGTVDGGALGLSGRATGVLVRPDGTTTFCTGTAADRVGPSTFTLVRLLATGAPDPGFGGTGVVSLPLTPIGGPGAGAAAVRGGPSGTLLVAGTDASERGTERGVVLRLRPDGTLDPRFGTGGIIRVARSGRSLRLAAMVRDPHGRILLAGTGPAPGGLVVRLRASGRRDRTFGNGGLTYPRLGRPPGGDPIYTTLDAIDADGSRALLAGSAAGPGTLLRAPGGTTYLGRFALTVSRLR